MQAEYLIRENLHNYDKVSAVDKLRDSNHGLRYVLIRGSRLWKKHVTSDLVECFNRSGEAVSGLFKVVLGVLIFSLRFTALTLEQISKGLDSKQREPELQPHQEIIQDLD